MPNEELIAYNGANWVIIPGVPENDGNQIQQMLACYEMGMNQELTAATFERSRAWLVDRISDWTKKGYLYEVQRMKARERSLWLSATNGIVADRWFEILSKVLKDATANSTSPKTRLEIAMFLKEQFIDPITAFKEDPGSREQAYVDEHSGNFSPTTVLPAQT